MNNREVSKRVMTKTTPAMISSYDTACATNKNAIYSSNVIGAIHKMTARRMPAIITIALPLLAVMLVQAAADAEYVQGHGTGSETFPPRDLNGRSVTLEVSSSAPPPPETTGRPPAGIKPGENLQIGVALVDFDSKVTLRDVTFAIRAERGDKLLFEQEFEADGGFVVFNFASDKDAQIITVNDKGDTGEAPDLFSYLLGAESRTVDVTGPGLADGGLYRFEVSILTAGGYAERLEEPLTYSSGISVPQITTYGIEDPNFGDQYIRVITYYDEIRDFAYDSESSEISFTMPFEWSDANLNQSYVVHQEISIPDSYGDMLLAEFEIVINGVTLPEDTVVIDDYFTGERIVHFIVPQERLYDVRADSINIDDSGTKSGMMNFLISPGGEKDRARLTSVTENGQFRIFVSWEPEELKQGQSAKILFEIADVFLRNVPVAEEYMFFVTTKDGDVIFEQSGTSSDSRENPINIAEFVIPPDVSGIVYLNFDKIDENNLASASIPIVVDRIQGSAIVDDGTTGHNIEPSDVNNNSIESNPNENGGCLIATAVFGSELAPQVQHLREIRDSSILQTKSGAAFMSAFNAAYYSFSPAVSDMQRENPMLRETTKVVLVPMLASLMLFDYASMETESDVILYGVAIIALNILMYIVPPTLALVVICKISQGRVHLHRTSHLGCTGNSQ